MTDAMFEALVETMHERDAYRRVEVITGRRRRQDWTADQKARIVAENFRPGANTSEVARRNGVTRGLLGVWRKQARVAVMPVAPAPLFATVKIEDRALSMTLRFRRRAKLSACGRDLLPWNYPVPRFVCQMALIIRRGVHGLLALVADGLQGNPYAGDICVFRSKGGNRLNILAFDGTGMILATKWVESGKLFWPPIKNGTMRVTAAQLAMLVEGLSEWIRIVPKLVKRPLITA